jgi:two-component system response regulator YesN
MKSIRKSFFLTFLSSSIILVLINLLTLFSVFVISSREQFDLEMNRVSLQLDRSLDLLESRFDEIANMALRLSQDPLMVNAIRITPPTTNRLYATLTRMERQFHHYNQQTTFVDQIFIILKRSGIIITDFGTSPDIREYAKNFFTYSTMNYGEWEKAIDIWGDKPSFLPADNITTMKNEVHAITFRYPISISIASPSAAYVALIPVEKIDYYFEELLGRGCILNVSDSTGKLLYQNKKNIKSGNFTTLKAENQYLQIILTVPHSYINDRLNTNRQSIIAVLVVNLIIITVIALFLARRNSQPLDSLIQKLSLFVPEQSRPRESSYQWLEESLEKIVGDKIDTESTIAMQWARLRIGFYEQLIRGSFADEEEIDEYLRSINISRPGGDHFVALYVVIPGGHEDQPDPTAQKMILHTYMAKHSFPEWHHHQNGLGEVLVIPAHRSFEDFLIKNQEELFRNTGVVTLLCFGRTKETLFELKDSFEDTRKLLYTSERKAKTPQILKFTTYESIDHNYKYDNADRELLSAAVYSGETNKVINALDRIFDKNYHHETIPTSGLVRLFSDITTTVCDIVRKKGTGLDSIPVNYNRYLELSSSQEDFYERIITLLTPITEYMGKDKKSHNNQLLGDIKKYLEDNFKDPMLCQSSVATQFKLNPQYLSRFFKEQTGESFSSYLEKLRMDQALTILKDEKNHDTLREVAEKSGYLSWNSFYKAFKRIHSISPGEFRKNALNR